MVKDAGEPVKNFVEMSKNDPKFKDYYRDFTDVGVQIFKIREKPHADFAQLKEREGIKAPKESKANKPPLFWRLGLRSHLPICKTAPPAYTAKGTTVFSADLYLARPDLHL